MPTYEYVCANCTNAWEEIQKITEASLDTCPKCGKATAKRQISGGSFILKGGGWYADLYSSSKPSGGGSSGSSDSSGGAKSETKSETKTESTATKSESTSSTPSTTPSAKSAAE